MGSMIVAAAISARGCAEDDVGNSSSLVGGSCIDDHDCEYRCVRGGDFPNGTCTRACQHDPDCPDGTRCVDKAGGICLLGCEHHADCRRDYECKRTDRRGHSGNIHVCID
jgi:hypothetical protein